MNTDQHEHFPSSQRDPYLLIVHAGSSVRHLLVCLLLTGSDGDHTPTPGITQGLQVIPKEIRGWEGGRRAVYWISDDDATLALAKATFLPGQDCQKVRVMKQVRICGNRRRSQRHNHLDFPAKFIHMTSVCLKITLHT